VTDSGAKCANQRRQALFTLRQLGVPAADRVLRQGTD